MSLVQRTFGKCTVSLRAVVGVTIYWSLVIGVSGTSIKAEDPSAATSSRESQLIESETSGNLRKSEALRLLNEAKRAVGRGDEARARSLARKAAEIPTTWDTRELTPERFLRELDRRGVSPAGIDGSRAVESLPAPADPHILPQPPALAAPIEPAATASRNALEADTVIEPFRRQPKSLAESTDETDGSELDSAGAPPLSDSTDGHSSFVEQASANDASGDAAVLDLAGPSSYSDARMLDVRVHDFSTSGTGRHVNSSTGNFLTQLAGVVVAIALTMLIVGLGCVLLARRLVARGDIVIRIEVGAASAGSRNDEFDRAQPLRLARDSTSEGKDVVGDPQSVPAENAALGARGPRNPGGGAAA
jgi:hypothetical protein